jgi:hypothetical protein
VRLDALGGGGGREAADGHAGDRRSGRDEDHGCRAGCEKQRADADADPQAGAVPLRRGLARGPFDRTAAVVRRQRFCNGRGLAGGFTGCGDKVGHDSPPEMWRDSFSIIRGRR